MKSNIVLFVLANAFVLLCLTNCTKAKDITEADIIGEEKQQTQTFQFNRDDIVGSWQFVEKIFNCDEGHQFHTSFEKVTSEEKRAFSQNGDYSLYMGKNEICQETYKIANTGALEVTNKCQYSDETIIELTSTSLTLKIEDSYFKYHKLD